MLFHGCVSCWWSGIETLIRKTDAYSFADWLSLKPQIYSDRQCSKYRRILDRCGMMAQKSILQNSASIVAVFAEACLTSKTVREPIILFGFLWPGVILWMTCSHICRKFMIHWGSLVNCISAREIMKGKARWVFLQYFVQNYSSPHLCREGKWIKKWRYMIYYCLYLN